MSDIVSVALLWDTGPVEGTVEVINGKLEGLRIASGRGSATGAAFRVGSSGPARVEATLASCRTAPGANPTMVRVTAQKSPITFFLRDITPQTPVWVPEYGIAVTAASDRRSYAALTKAIRTRRLRSGLDHIGRLPEETFEKAAAHNRDMTCPTWLGLGRDMRLFRLSVEEQFGYWGWLQPAYHSFVRTLPETSNREYALHFVIGPGASCRSRIVRRLDDGVLPILHSTQYEDDVEYRLTAFATLETQVLSPTAVRGTDWRVAYAFTGGNMYSTEDKQKLAAEIEMETRGRKEEVVCCLRVEAINRGNVPRYAWFKALRMSQTTAHAFDGECGFSILGAGQVYAVHLLGGRPMPQEEMAVMLQPGRQVCLDMFVPHQPIPGPRAARLASLDFDKHLAACRTRTAARHGW